MNLDCRMNDLAADVIDLHHILRIIKQTLMLYMMQNVAINTEKQRQNIDFCASASLRLCVNEL